MVIAATEWVERGVGADEIVTRLQKMVLRGRIYFLVATLEYLQKGGRIGGAAALIGSALQIKPILELKNGRVEALEKVRTYHHALARVKELVIEQCPRSREAHLCVMHADDQAGAQRLANDLRSALKIGAIPIYPCSASITTHVGLRALAVGFFV
jgi:DegV family protein with EDD domain